MCECCSRQSQENQDSVLVKDVSCGHCLASIKNTLGRAPGVLNVEHLTESKEARISFDKRIITREKLEKIMNLSGYELVS